MIRVIIFDVDGVLINGEIFSNEIERKYNVSNQKTQSFFSSEFQKCLIGKNDLKVQLAPYLKQWGWQKSVQEYLDEWFAYENNVDPELIEYIQQIRSKGIKCCVATNQEKYRADYILNEMGFSNNFDKFYSSASLGVQKPDAIFFEKILKDLGNFESQDVLFWDDLPKNVDSAKHIGMQAELYENFADFKIKMKLYV